MGYHAKITSKGQMTIPREVRDALGVVAGDRVVFEIVDGEARMRAVPAAMTLIGIARQFTASPVLRWPEERRTAWDAVARDFENTDKV